MEKKKSIITSSLIASAIVACASFTTNAAEVFHYNNLGSGEEIRTNLLEKTGSNHRLELTCSTGSQSGTHKNKKEHKCGKKDKDGKCGEGKCGDKKKEADKKEADKK